MSEKLKKIPKKYIYAGIGIVVALIATIIIVVTSKPTINLNDYLMYDVKGYNNYAECSIKVDWDAIKEDYSEKVEYTKKAKEDYGNLLLLQEPIDVIFNDSSITVDKKTNLKNDDVVNYTWHVNDEELKKYINCKVVYSNGNYKISGLEDAISIDFYSNFSDPIVTFTGRSGNTSPILNCDLENDFEIFNDGNISVVLKQNEERPTMQVIKDNQLLCKLGFSFNYEEGLSNNDVITLSINGIDELMELGYVPKEDNLTFKVENRPEIIKSAEDVDIDKIKDYIQTRLPKDSKDIANSSTYSNMVIHNIYLAREKDVIGNNTVAYILVDYSYDENYKFRNIVDMNTKHAWHMEFYNAYFDNDEFCFDGVTSSTYTAYLEANVDAYIENHSNKYEFEKIY